MADNEDITQRLNEYSLRTNTNAMQTALLDQRLTVNEKRTDEYHIRLHKQEDEMLVVKTVQQIHDTQINGMRKILIGNGTRDTIPMDLDRLENAIQDILKTNYRQIQIDLETVKKWQDNFDKKLTLIWGAIAILVINRVWEFFVT